MTTPQEEHNRRVAAIEAGRERGATLTAVAKELGMTVASLSQWSRSRKISTEDFRRGRAQRRTMSPENEARKQRILDGLRAGKTLSHLAPAEGMATKNLFQWCASWGLPTAPDQVSDTSTLGDEQKAWGDDDTPTRRREKIREVATRLRDGERLEAIASRTFDVSTAVLKLWCRKQGIPISAGEPLYAFIDKLDRDEKNRLAAGRVVLPSKVAKRLLPHSQKRRMSPEIMVGEIVERLLDEPKLIGELLGW